MKVLVTGAKGQLGHDVTALLEQRGVPCLGADTEEFDITNARQTEAFLRAYAPDAVVHCAAFTNVDGAEKDRDASYRVNVTGTENVARAAAALGAKLVYISTDYVFDGTGEKPWRTDSPVSPVNRYGETKLGGELAVRDATDRHFIVRTSWVFGLHGKNFVKTMLRLGAEKDRLTVVDDQIGSPTYTRDLARLLCDMLPTEKYGTYHAANEGFCSWCEFAREIMREGGRACRVDPISSEEYARMVPAAAARPKNSRLDRSSLDEAGFARLPSWRDALARYMTELKEAGEL